MNRRSDFAVLIPCRYALPALLVLAAAGQQVPWATADEIKANNSDPLNTGTSWVSGFGTGASILPTGESVPHTAAHPGDFDSDGDVDGADFVVWQTNFPFTPGPGASSIPEPASMVTAVITLVLGGWTQRRNSQSLDLRQGENA